MLGAFVSCEEMSRAEFTKDMYGLFRTRNGRFINTRHEMVSEQLKRCSG